MNVNLDTEELFLDDNVIIGLGPRLEMRNFNNCISNFDLTTITIPFPFPFPRFRISVNSTYPPNSGTAVSDGEKKMNILCYYCYKILCQP